MDSFTGRRAAADVLTTLGFFTRIPVSGPIGGTLSSAIWAAPIVGFIVAVTGAACFAIAAAVGLPASISAVFALAATMLVTGCLHEDGLADVADGFGGGATRARKLEIMRDSRIGTYGVAALILTIVTRWAALSELAGAVAVLSALIAAHAASRGLIAPFMLLVSPARTDGLAARAGTVPSSVAATAVLIGGAGLLVLGLFPALIAVIGLLIWSAALKLLCERQIGGQTGDVLGTLQQGGEIIVLLVAVAFHP